MTANPFANLIQQITHQRRAARTFSVNHSENRPMTKTDRMRQYLRQRGEATAADLAIEADLCGSTGNVYALLKNDIAKGAIELRGQYYVWVDSFDAQKQQLIREAIRTLMRAGYTVIKKEEAA